MSDLWRLITLSDANTRIVLLGTSMLGAGAGLVGALAVLRRRALMGDAVAHAALPGVYAAFFIVGAKSMPALLAGSLVLGVLAAGFVAVIKSSTRVREDAAVGMVIGGFFGVGTVLGSIAQRSATGSVAGLDHFVFGKAASMVREDALVIGITGAVVLACVAALHKEFKTLCFDRGFASALGWPAGGLDLALMALVCLCTVAGLPAVGAVLMVSLLVIPGAAARFWTDRLGHMLVLAAGIGAFSGAAGTIASAVLPVPTGASGRGWATGPMITLAAAACFAVSLVCAPGRGVLARAGRARQLRRRIARQNLLRRVWEATETAAAEGRRRIVQGHDLGRGRAVGSLRAAARGAERAGLIRSVGPDAASLELTEEGEEEAWRVVRAHRLWELYLIEHADIAADHVDRDADELEHVLPAGVIAGLERQLVERGTLPPPPARREVPRSPHALNAADSSGGGGGGGRDGGADVGDGHARGASASEPRSVGA